MPAAAPAALLAAAALVLVGLWRIASAADDVPVTFVVDVPAGTPADAVIWIAGDRPELGAWNGAGLRLAPAGARRHVGTVLLPRATTIEFKVTRGGWTTVEKDGHGGEIANRAHVVAAAETLRAVVAAWRDQGEGVTAARRSTIRGRVDRRAAFPSAFVRARDVWVYLPPGYEPADSTRRYPVLYFHDGNNLFDESTAFIGVEWGVDEVAERDIAAGRLPPFIAVAIANTPERMAEYTWTADPGLVAGGQAGAYARFLIEELKPWVDRTYATDPRPEATGVVGSSLGGIVSLWLGLQHPEVFRGVGCVSPAAGWAGRDLARIVRAGEGTGLRIWLDTGTAEVAAGRHEHGWLDDARDLRDALLARGYRLDSDLHYEEIAGGRHDERAWAARIDRILAYLLASPGPAAPPAR